MPHKERKGVLFIGVLTTLMLISLTIIVAHTIGTHILHSYILNGKYSFEQYSDYSSYPVVQLMRINCIMYSLLLVLIIIGIGLWQVIKGKVSIKMLKICSISSITLLIMGSLYAMIELNEDDVWYFRSDKTLAFDSERYYKDIVTVYNLCNKYNTSISKGYDEYLTSALIDTIFYFKDSKGSVNTLKDKDDKYQKLRNLVSLYDSGFWDGDPRRLLFIRNDNLRMIECDHNMLKELSRVIDVNTLECLCDSIIETQSLLNYRLNHPKVTLSTEQIEKTRTLLSIGNEIKSLADIFIFYVKHPEVTKASKVTWEAQGRCNQIDKYLNNYKEMYNIE